jgi:hypothetical protein
MGEERAEAQIVIRLADAAEYVVAECIEHTKNRRSDVCEDCEEQVGGTPAHMAVAGMAETLRYLEMHGMVSLAPAPGTSDGGTITANA